MPPFTVQPTPNPNSLKFTASDRAFIEEGMGAFASAAEAEGDALGAPLFALDGVHNVLVLPGFVTVTKTTETDWDALLPRIEAILTEHLAA
ncbi:MAG: NifU N-terminal domain-containing protein [Bacteroidota bacterium]